MSEVFEGIRSFIMQWLDPIGIVVGLIIAVPVFWTWYQVIWGERRQNRKVFASIRRNPGNQPTIIILDLLTGRDICTQVENFRRTDKNLRDIPEERIIKVSRDKPLQPEDMPDLHRDLRDAARKVQAFGTDRVHLFFAAPMPAAAVMGAAFASLPVTLYHFDKERGRYVNFGPLHMLQ